MRAAGGGIGRTTDPTEHILSKGTTTGTDFLPDADYRQHVEDHVLRQVRPDDRIILDIGCRDGALARKLKQLRPDRTVFGIATAGQEAAASGAALDAVYAVDVENELPPVEPESVDCIILNDVLQEMRDPGELLARLKPLLRAGGRIVFSVPNVQHFSVLASIISGDFQHRREGAIQRDHRRFFGAANIQKMCLDAGFLPQLAESLQMPIPPETADAYVNLAGHLKLNVDFFRAKASIYQYVCTASPMADALATTGGITFIVAVNNFRQFQDNLLASPILQTNRHEIVPVTGASSAAEAFRKGLSLSARRNRLYVLLHQDIYLPAGWDDRLIAGIAAAEQQYGPVGVAGVFGVVQNPLERFERAGVVIDRNTLLATGHQFPAMAISLDEIVLAFPVQNGSLVALEETLGFHMYGSDACLAANDFNQAAVIVDAPCFHNSETAYSLGDDSFARSAQIFAQRRAGRFPYASTCAQFIPDGRVVSW
jgi:SAM-dependent methyltransferase